MEFLTVKETMCQSDREIGGERERLYDSVLEKEIARPNHFEFEIESERERVGMGASECVRERMRQLFVCNFL